MVLNLAPAQDVYAQLEAALQEIRELRAKLEMRPKLLSPSEYARLYRVSISTVNRALNHELGYKLKGYAESRIVGHHQNGSPVVRWYIDPDARIIHQKAKK